MSTPTDPYNTGSNTPFDDEKILDPIAEPEAEGQVVDYGAGDALAWENAWGATEAAAQPAPEEPAEATEADSPAEAPTGEPVETTEAAAVAEDRPEASNRTLADVLQDSLPEPDDEPQGIKRTSVFGAATEAPAGTATGAAAGVAGSAAVFGATRAAGDKPAPDAAGEPAVVPNEDFDSQAKAGTLPGDAARSDSWSAAPSPAELNDIPEEPKKRTWSHAGSFFFTLLLLPVAWYLLSDAGARLFLVADNPWETGSQNWLALVELLGGLVVAGVVWLLAKSSSLGAQFWGAIVGLGGLVAVAVPSLGKELVDRLDQLIGDYNPFTGNVIHHLNMDLGTGRIAIAGVILFLTGLIAHQTRRTGERTGVAVTRRAQMLAEKAD